jgi:hypothetical protein
LILHPFGHWPEVSTASSFATAWSIVKLAAFCGGGLFGLHRESQLGSRIHRTVGILVGFFLDEIR